MGIRIDIYSRKYAQALEEEEAVAPEDPLAEAPVVIEKPVEEPGMPIDEMEPEDIEVQEIALVPAAYRGRRGPQVAVYDPLTESPFLTTAPGTEFVGLDPNTVPAGQSVISGEDIIGIPNIKTLLKDYANKPDEKIWIDYITLGGNIRIQRDISPDDIFIAGTGNEICVAWDHMRNDWRAYVLPRIQRARTYQLMT
jgi:hypothetical protein